MPEQHEGTCPPNLPKTSRSLHNFSDIKRVFSRCMRCNFRITRNNLVVKGGIKIKLGTTHFRGKGAHPVCLSKLGTNAPWAPLGPTVPTQNSRYKKGFVAEMQ